MIQKQGDDGDHNFEFEPWGKHSTRARTHAFTVTGMRARHSLTHLPSHTHRLPPGYRDLIEFFSRYPGLVKWTGIPLLLYFNAGILDAAPMFTL